MNRVLIFGLPRTGTTLLEEILKKTYSQPIQIEPYGFDDIRLNYIEYTKKIKPNSVVKLLTTSCYCERPVDVPQLLGLGIFDKIVVTQRKDLVATCLSLFYADYVVQKYAWEPHETIKQQPFKCDVRFALNFCRQNLFFKKTIDWFDKIKIQYDRFDYDKFLDGEDQSVFGIVINNQAQSKFKKTNIDYQSLCHNYQEIKELIMSSF